MSRRPPPDPIEWARAQVNTKGQRCSLCRSTELSGFAREVVKLWAAGKTRPGAMSWPKIADQIRLSFGTRTHWISVRNHFRDHESPIYERLENRLHGQAH